jgi:hypothetical protein
MSDYLADGQERTIKTVRLKMNLNLVNQYEELTNTNKPTFSFLINSLLQDWLVVEQLKAEFEKRGLSE